MPYNIASPLEVRRKELEPSCKSPFFSNAYAVDIEGVSLKKGEYGPIIDPYSECR